jgi:hypothetical protein
MRGMKQADNTMSDNLMFDQPMLYTAIGNMPLADLDPMEVIWERTETYVKIRLIHKYQGKVVREEAHVLALEPLYFDANTGALN